MAPKSTRKDVAKRLKGLMADGFKPYLHGDDNGSCTLYSRKPTDKEFEDGVDDKLVLAEFAQHNSEGYITGAEALFAEILGIEFGSN